jgi:hypothetical protein
MFHVLHVYMYYIYIHIYIHIYIYIYNMERVSNRTTTVKQDEHRSKTGDCLQRLALPQPPSAVGFTAAGPAAMTKNTLESHEGRFRDLKRFIVRSIYKKRLKSMCFPLQKMIDKDTLVFLLICLLICYQEGHV